MKQESKGKQREAHNDINDTRIDISLRSFIDEQIDSLQTALSVPPQEELGCSDAEYKQVERAVRQIKWAYPRIHP